MAYIVLSAVYLPVFSRWGQPAQQQGRRIPDLSFEIPTATRLSRVSAFFAESTQQIHSLRASGVMSFHAIAKSFFMSALCQSAGIVCTVPLGRVIVFITIHSTTKGCVAWACYTKYMQRIATLIFICASVIFGILGILVVLVQPTDNNVLSKLLMITVFIILPSFALSVAGKYLNSKSDKPK